MTDTIEMRWSRHNEAGRSYFSQGDLARAEQAFVAAIREAKSMGGDGLHLATSLGNLGQLRYRRRDYPQAEALFRHALAIREQALGPDDHGIVQSINNLAALHYVRDELADAEPLFRRALTISEAHLGLSHPDLAVGLNNLAKLYMRMRDFGNAAPLLVRLAGIKKEVHGPHHLETAAVLLMLARVRFALRETGEAERLCREVLAVQEAVLPPDDAALAVTRTLLDEIIAVRPAAAVDRYKPASSQDQAIANGGPGSQPPAHRQDLAAGEGAGPQVAPSKAEMPPQLPELPRPAPEIQILKSAGDSLGGQPLSPLGATPPTPDVRISTEPLVPDGRSSMEPIAPPFREPAEAAQSKSEMTSGEGDGWTLDPRDVSDGSAGITQLHAPDHLQAASPVPAVSHEVEKESPDAMELASPSLREHAGTTEDQFLDDPIEEVFKVPSYGRESRRAMRSWPHYESRGKTVAIAAAVALVLVAAGWFAFLRDDAEASATSPLSVEAPSTSEPPVEPATPAPVGPSSTQTADAAEAIVDTAGGFDRGVPSEAERVRMGVAESGHRTERDRIITSGDPSEPPPLPNVRVNLDPISRSIARTKARVDSLGREIPAEPIQFQRPTPP